MRKSHSILLIAVLMTSLAATVFAADAQNALPAGVVNINTADVTQLSYLPRVGKAAAQRIVDYRTEHGPFAKPSDLMQVKGFGEKTFERIARYLTVDGKTTLSAKVKSPVKPRSKPSTTASE
ncbi:MAG TPA: helix-hairpin-helix domain-containing protein [Thermoanaerobaculia bacterium]|nr:helix-hairpin-helix domain-containing protein [Thermoanaerobaculia bacterium]